MWQRARSEGPPALRSVTAARGGRRGGAEVGPGHRGRPRGARGQCHAGHGACAPQARGPVTSSALPRERAAPPALLALLEAGHPGRHQGRATSARSSRASRGARRLTTSTRCSPTSNAGRRSRSPGSRSAARLPGVADLAECLHALAEGETSVDAVSCRRLTRSSRTRSARPHHAQLDPQGEG